jgi:hypothetical protein
LQTIGLQNEPAHAPLEPQLQGAPFHTPRGRSTPRSAKRSR